MTGSSKRFFSIVCVLLLFARNTDAADLLTAKFSNNLDTVSVRFCFDGPAPVQLFRHPDSEDWSDGIYLAGQKLELSQTYGGIGLPRLADNACIHWQSDINSALEKEDYRLVLKRDHDLVMSANLWFWKGPRQRDLLVRVILPDGMSFSAPWAKLESTPAYSSYRPDSTPELWESKVAIGRFELQNIEIPGARVRLAALGDLANAQREKFRRWITESVLAVTSVIGRFPQPQPQVLVIPVGPRHEATLGAQVIRGGGLAAVLLVDENRPLEDYTSDWTATHEFSHMLFPYISSRDRWLSEGMASYYQNVLRARNGRLTEKQAWQALYEGFKRGEKSTHGGSLAQASREGWRSTMRVYWSGAAMMLQADIQLRQHSNGGQSLDSALKALSDCCLENGKTWRAREMFAQLDKLTGTHVFTRLYKKHVHVENFPDMHSTWQQLGVNTRGGQVSLDENAPLAQIRTSIMQG